MNIPNDAWPYIIGFGIFILVVILFGLSGKEKKKDSPKEIPKPEPASPKAEKQNEIKPPTPKLEPKPISEACFMTQGQGYIIIALLIAASGFTFFEKLKPIEQWS